MSQQQATSPLGPRRIGEDDAQVAAQRRPAGPVFWVFQTWCRKGSPMTPHARHVLVHIAKRMQADANGRQVAFMGEGRWSRIPLYPRAQFDERSGNSEAPA